MRALVVRQKSAMVGESCGHCTKKIKAGDVVLVDRLSAYKLPFGMKRDRLFHVECIKDLVERAPLGKRDFERIRDDLVASADLFV